MRCGRESGHVATRVAEDHLGGAEPHPGARAQQSDREGERCDLLVGCIGEPSDLAAQEVAMHDEADEGARSAIRRSGGTSTQRRNGLTGSISNSSASRATTRC